uniref:Uncharacterized protein n=1 Tax=Rhipicephalus appendiculatus TaxID=34631 RepID=A0A131YDM1_RHIAP
MMSRSGTLMQISLFKLFALTLLQAKKKDVFAELYSKFSHSQIRVLVIFMWLCVFIFNILMCVYTYICICLYVHVYINTCVFYNKISLSD